MTKFTTKNTDYIKVKGEKKGENITLMKKAKFESFNEEILGLGKIDTKSTQINALSIMFDLEGFTHFCKQIDPQLAVPEYLSEFLSWLFEQIRKELLNKTFPEGYYTYSEFPFLSKFMGDGVLFLWDTEELSETEILNIVISMHEICKNYEAKFYKTISKKITSSPKKLRCGIARGSIYSVGNGNDFVGPCINMSARLQKLNSLNFCFSRRGLNLNSSPYLKRYFITTKTDIRGIGSEELVCVPKSEFAELSKKDKDRFIELD